MEANRADLLFCVYTVSDADAFNPLCSNPDHLFRSNIFPIPLCLTPRRRTASELKTIKVER